jgi:hypothetical protein
MAVIALETSEQLSRALGDAVVRIWGRLPPHLQNRLFEEAVTSQDEMRPRLAVYLHEKHPRTCAAVRARAMLEPDSLRGLAGVTNPLPWLSKGPQTVQILQNS